MIVVNATGNAKNYFDDLEKSAKHSDNAISSLITQIGGMVAVDKVVRSTITTFADLQEQILDIQKTTGLAGKGLDELTKSLNDLSVTNRGMEVSSLYKISAIAGQLGIKGKENIISFTEEIKKLSATSTLTAEQAGEGFARLSNSLNEPIKNIAKLTSTFTALASATTANEQSLLDYVQRLAGVGKTIGLTSAQIAGLGATLNDIGLSSELSTTAISQLLMKFMTDTKKVTDTLKIDFTEFSDMVKNKPNQALLVFLDTLNKLDKSSKVQALKDMKLSGAGLSQTLLKLSANTEKLTQNIGVANRAYREGTATTKEFEIASQSLRAKQEQLTSAFKLAGYEVGKRLQPALVATIDALIPLANYIKQNSEQIVAWSKIIGITIIAWKGLNAVMSLSPFGRVVAGITAIIGAITGAIAYIKKMKSLLDDSKQAVEEYTRKINSEEYKTQQKIKQLTELKKKQDEYRRAIELTNKLLNNKNIGEAQRKVLEQNLIMQGKKYNQLVLQTRELSKQVKLTSGKPINTTSTQTTTKVTNIKVGNVDIPKIPTITKVDIKPIVSKKATTKAKKDLSNLLEQFKDDYNRTILDNYNYQKLKLKKQYNDYKKVVKDKNKLDEWYNKKLKALDDERLKKKTEAYIKVATKEYRLRIEQNKKILEQELESIKKAEEERKKKLKETEDILNTMFSSISANLDINIDKGQLDSLFSILSKNISKSINEGFDKADWSLTNSKGELTEFGGVLANVVGGTIQNSIINSSKNGEFQQQVIGIGSALGTAVGTVFGGALGGAIGGVAGSALGSLVSGKKDSIKTIVSSDREQLYVNRYRDHGLFGGKSTKELTGESIKATQIYQSTLDAFEQNVKDMGLSTRAFEVRLSQDVKTGKKYDFEDLMRDVNQSYFETLTGVDEGIRNLLRTFHVSRDKSMEVANAVQAEDFDTYYNALVAVQRDYGNALLDEAWIVRQNWERAKELQAQWKLFAESTNTTVADAISQSINAIENINIALKRASLSTPEQVAKFDKEQLQRSIQELNNSDTIQQALKEYLNLTYTGTTAGNSEFDFTKSKEIYDIANIQEYEYYTQVLQQNGLVTPQVSQALQELGNQLVALEQITQKEREAQRQLAEQREDAVKKLIEERKQLDLSNKVFLVQYRSQMRDLKDTEVERIEAVREALEYNLQSINENLRGFISGWKTESSFTDRDNALIAFNESLNKIKGTTGSVTQEEYDKLLNSLNQSLSELKSYSAEGEIKNEEIVRFSLEARKALEDLTAKQTQTQIGDISTKNDNATNELIAQAIDRALGRDRTVREVNNTQLADILNRGNFNYNQTAQIIKAFNDNILTSQEVLGIEDITKAQQNLIAGQTGIDLTGKTSTTDTHLQRLVEAEKKTNEQLEEIYRLQGINATEARNSRNILEDILEKL